jgi:hypothetical protein
MKTTFLEKRRASQTKERKDQERTNLFWEMHTISFLYSFGPVTQGESMPRKAMVILGFK